MNRRSSLTSPSIMPSATVRQRPPPASAAFSFSKRMFLGCLNYGVMDTGSTEAGALLSRHCTLPFLDHSWREIDPLSRALELPQYTGVYIFELTDGGVMVTMV